MKKNYYRIRKYRNKKRQQSHDFFVDFVLSIGVMFLFGYLFYYYRGSFFAISILLLVLGISVGIYISYVVSWKQKTLQQLRKMDPYEFERYIAKLYKKLGYKANVTPKRGDFGADIELFDGKEKIVVQCKRYSEDNKVTSPDLQKTQGSVSAYNAVRAICVTTSDYTSDAKQFAYMVGMELVDSKILMNMIKQVIDINANKKTLFHVAYKSLVYGFMKKR